MIKVLKVPLCWWRSFNSWLEKRSTLLSAWSSLITIVVVPIILFGGYATWIQVSNYLSRPDIALHLKTPKHVRFSLLNLSSVLLREPHYAFNLWDLDARVQGKGDDPGNLRIPTKTLEYILPNSGIGPWVIDNLSETASRVPDGNVVFGWVSIRCPDCELRRHYWLLIKKGETAWYYEIPPEEQLSIMKNLQIVLKADKHYPEAIGKVVPIERRIPVRDGL